MKSVFSQSIRNLFLKKTPHSRCEIVFLHPIIGKETLQNIRK